MGVFFNEVKMEKYILMLKDVFYPDKHSKLLQGIEYKIVSENLTSYFLTEKKLSLDKKYDGRIFEVDMI
jgi:hypothetical protein